MALIKTQAGIKNELIETLRISQPGLDTKPGEIATDLFIDLPSIQLAKLYEENRKVSTNQSFQSQFGKDLENSGSNLGKTKSKGAKSRGTAVLTFPSLESDILINQGDLVFAKNGSTFILSNSKTLSSVFANNFRAVASKYKSNLEELGITDQYAVEVLLEATAAGTQGNISKYGLASTSIPGAKVFNVQPFGGGTAPQSDTSFKNDILAAFNGPGAGTVLSLKNTALADPAVLDVIVIEPGDDLMLRDGTKVATQSDGSTKIISEGVGGKIDVLIFGNRVQNATDTYIYKDISNTGNPTNPKNDFILGQIDEDKNKTVLKRRKDNISSGILPNQPINNLVSVSGSRSGSNFLLKSVDNFGRISGNYELIRDEGIYSGSAWGHDRLHWISDRISNFSEDLNKNLFNGLDALSYTDVSEIRNIESYISIINENGKINVKNRSEIQLAHFPIKVVSKISNTTTGERYTIVNTNKSTGLVTISGQTLPTASDILQIDYTWILNHDPNFDFTNTQNSVDWSLSNQILRERTVCQESGSYLTVTTTYNISNLLQAYLFQEEISTIEIVSGQFAVITSQVISNIVSIIRTSDQLELWNSDGTISGMTAFLSDVSVLFGQEVKIVYNTTSIIDNSNFSNKTVTLTPNINDSGLTSNSIIELSYVANTTSELMPAVKLSDLPILKNNNVFSSLASSEIGQQPCSDLKKSPTFLSLTLTGTITPGSFTIAGTSFHFVNGIVYVVSSSNLKQDLSSAIKKYLNVNSNYTLSKNIKIAKIVKMEKVETDDNLNVLSSLHTYNLHGYSLLDNSITKSIAIQDSTLKNTEFKLSDLQDNIDNLPKIGDKIKISFYYFMINDSENIVFNKAGTLFSVKKYYQINSISIGSGFLSESSQNATLSVSYLNQPNFQTKYRVYYDYLAPKPNERIFIEYNYDKLIGDVTLQIEDKSRRTGDDILVKSMKPILVDTTVAIAIIQSNDFKNSSEIIKQNVKNILTSLLNATQANTSLDASDIINQVYKVPGVDRVRILYFNKTGLPGSTLTINANKNEYLVANQVNVEIESK